jgi:hypothetical protein
MKAHFFDKNGNFVMTKELDDYNGIPIYREPKFPKDLIFDINKTLPSYIPEMMTCYIVEYRRVCTLYNRAIIFEERWD